MFSKARKMALKQRYVFIAIKDKSLRTVRIKGHTHAEAEEKVKRKYPDWKVRPYSTN